MRWLCKRTGAVRAGCAERARWTSLARIRGLQAGQRTLEPGATSSRRCSARDSWPRWSTSPPSEASRPTVARVVARSGVSRRTFYDHFEDREACFLAAFEDGVARATRRVLAAYDPKARWAERIRTALTALLSFLDADRAVGRLLLVGSLGAGAEALERRQAVLARAIAVVDEGREETKAGADLPALTAEGVVGGVLSVLHARLLDPGSPPLVELTSQLMATIVLPYLGASRLAQGALPAQCPRAPSPAEHGGQSPRRP